MHEACTCVSTERGLPGGVLVLRVGVSLEIQPLTVPWTVGALLAVLLIHCETVMVGVQGLQEGQCQTNTILFTKSDSLKS